MTLSRRTWLALPTALVLAWTAGAAPALAQGRDVLIFAAASMKNALDDIVAQWQRETGKKVVVSYAASNTLIKQIEQGAPADIFISADTDWMDYGEQKGLIKKDTRVNLLGNKLVLIAPKDANVTTDIKARFDLAALLKGGRLAMANVDAVPAGKYGKASLEKLGVWDSVKDKIAQADSVRAALVLVARGETPLGIVYQTDAASDPSVKIVGTFPADTHPPIIYPVALTKDFDERRRARVPHLHGNLAGSRPRLRQARLLGVRAGPLSGRVIEADAPSQRRAGAHLAWRAGPAIDARLEEQVLHILEHASMGFREARELIAKSLLLGEHDQLERPPLLHVAPVVVVEKVVDGPDAFVRPSVQERFKIRFFGVVGQFAS